MSKLKPQSWQAIQVEVIRRINTRIWPPGEMLPNEVDLAAEFGCARATVNRALQALADKGLLERKRKAGTRVALTPVRKAVLSIPILREEIEQSGQAYGYKLLDAEVKPASQSVSDQLNIAIRQPVFHISALHLANGAPFVFEERVVNIDAMPAIYNVDLAEVSANEWLVQNAPFTRGTLAFHALAASTNVATLLNCDSGAPLFCLERQTWNNTQSITCARLFYAPGYRMETSI